MTTIAILGMGTMGAAVAEAYQAAGHRVLTDLTGRGAMSVKRATDRGIEVAPDLASLLAEAEIVFSIVPPEVAEAVAANVAALAAGLDTPPLYVDANAVSPATLARIAATCTSAGLPFLDGGIIGGPPHAGVLPKLYLAGADVERLAPLHNIAFDHRTIGAEPGAGSAFKMLFAGLNKGLNALLVCQLLSAEQFGVLDAFCDELADSQAFIMGRGEKLIPRMPADAGRWTAEMGEIAATLAAQGLPPGFHEAAGEIMRRLAASPYAGETRETVDASRTMKDTIRGI